MPPLQSSPVKAAMTVLADHFNKLRTDLLWTHDHSSGKGDTVDHAELADTGPMGGVFHDHSDINTHLIGNTGPPFVDYPGWDRRVHGIDGMWQGL